MHMMIDEAIMMAVAMCFNKHLTVQAYSKVWPVDSLGLNFY